MGGGDVVGVGAGERLEMEVNRDFSFIVCLYLDCLVNMSNVVVKLELGKYMWMCVHWARLSL